jgi:hypothetical protein
MHITNNCFVSAERYGAVQGRDRGLELVIWLIYSVMLTLSDLTI